MRYVLIMLIVLNTFIFAQDGNFTDSSLEEFAQYVSEKTNQTILFDSSVKGRKIFMYSFKWTTPEELFKIFEAVIEYNGFILEESSAGKIKVFKIKRNIQGPWTPTPVISPEELAQTDSDTYVTVVFRLNYVSSREIQTTFRALRIVNPQGGNLAGIEGSNTVVVSDYAGNVKRLGKLIQLMDTPATSTSEKKEIKKLEGQTIPVHIPAEHKNIFLDLKTNENTEVVVSDEKNNVLCYSLKGETQLYISPLCENNKKLNIQINTTRFTTSFADDKYAFNIAITSVNGDKKMVFWNAASERSYPIDQKVQFTLQPQIAK